LAEGKPPVEVELTWDGDLRFRGHAGQAAVVVDSDGLAGPSPVQSLALALAGCMSVDVVHILEKGRQPLRGLRASLPPELPLVVSGRAVNLLAKPIPDAHTAADFSSVMSKMRALGVLPATPVSLVGVLPDLPQRA